MTALVGVKHQLLWLAPGLVGYPQGPTGKPRVWAVGHGPADDSPRISTEMSLHVLAYNFKRVLSLLGNSALMAAMSLKPSSRPDELVAQHHGSRSFPNQLNDSGRHVRSPQGL